MKRILPVLCLVLALTASAAFAETELTFTFTGDVTLGSEEHIRNKPYSFDSVAMRDGYDYFFKNVRHLFEEDDVTVINLEGVLSDSPRQEKTTKVYRFRGPTDFVKILTQNSVEVANLSNNHTADFGEQGLRSTRQTLEDAGVEWIAAHHYWIYENGSVRVAFFSLFTTSFESNRDWCAEEMARLKDSGRVSAIVFVFHAGQEYSYKHRDRDQTKLGHWAVDNGADLVVMHHPHVLQGIEVYQGASICWSLGNFCFGGNVKVRELNTALVQAKMRFTEDGTYLGHQLLIYPAHISGLPEDNNFQPVLVKGAEADAVLAIMQGDTDFDLVPYDEALGYAPQRFISAGVKFRSPAGMDATRFIVTNAIDPISTAAPRLPGGPTPVPTLEGFGSLDDDE